MSEQKTRNSSFELMRIISMLMIIGSHYGLYGGFHFGNHVTVNRLFTQFLYNGGQFGVTCFVLLSGYFMSTAKEFRVERILKILCAIWFYSWIFLALLYKRNLLPQTPTVFIQNLFPVIFKRYWFMSVYVWLLCLSPYLNKMIWNCSRKEHKYLICFLLFLWGVFPTLISTINLIDPQLKLTVSGLYSSNFTWFVFLYILSAYLRKYPVEWFKSKYTYLLLSAGLYLFILLTEIILDYLVIHNPEYNSSIVYTYRKINSLPCFFAALCFFLFFSKHTFYSKKLNVLSGATFGVYLIHENAFIRPLLWEHIFTPVKWQKSLKLIPHALASVIIVYVCCTVIELCRMRFVEKPLMAKLTGKKCPKAF